MSKDLRDVATVMRTVASDCEADARQLDRTPFTARGVGEALGSQLAMIAACARAIAVVADELAQREEPQ